MATSSPLLVSVSLKCCHRFCSLTDSRAPFVPGSGPSENVQRVSTRGAGETPGFLQPLAALRFTRTLLNTRVCVFVQLPLRLPAQRLLRAALPNAGLL